MSFPLGSRLELVGAERMNDDIEDDQLAIKLAPMGVTGALRNVMTGFFCLFALFWGAWFTLGVALLVPVGLHRRFAGWCAGLLMELFVIVLGTRLQVDGLEHVDARQHYVIVANHRSWLDAVGVITALKPKKISPVFVVKRGLMLFPVFGIYMWLAGYVPVERSKGGRSGRNKKALERAARHVASGVTVLAFPEGTRSPTHRFIRFKKGAADLALASGTPLLPVAISGTPQLYPRGTPFVRPGKFRVEFLPPIVPTDTDTRDSLTRKAWDAITPRYRLEVDGPPLEETPEIAAKVTGAYPRDHSP